MIDMNAPYDAANRLADEKRQREHEETMRQLESPEFAKLIVRKLRKLGIKPLNRAAMKSEGGAG